MEFTPPLLPGRFIARRKRFLADIRLDSGEIVVAHCANTGAMTGCVEPNGKVALSDQSGRGRKLDYSWELSCVAGAWICVNTARPNQIVAEALENETIPELRGYPQRRREAPWPSGGRADFLLEGPQGRCFVEVKSVTLKIEDQARFPDAVTERGLRHLNALRHVLAQGDRGVMLFLVGREDCESFAPAAEVDPAYANTLGEVVQQGVEVLVYQCRVDPNHLQLDRPLPFTLPTAT